MSSLFRFISLSLCITALQSCVTPQEERRIKEDIARLQTQLAYMQDDVEKTGSSIKTDASKKTASINTKIEKFNLELQKMKGDLDTLRVGVITGELPGTGAENENSIAKTIAQMLERIDAIEKNQEKILDAIEEAGKKSKKSKKTRERAKLTSLKALQRAFDKKQYLYIVEDAKPVIKKNSNKAKHEAQYLYAESLYKLGRLRPAALGFNDFLEMKPKNHLAHAKLRLGDCFRHLGDRATAKLYYDELLNNHKDTAEAKLAMDRIEKL